MEKDKAALEVMVPSLRKKLRNKLEFETIRRNERNEDVLYTLVAAAHAHLKDMELRKK